MFDLLRLLKSIGYAIDGIKTAFQTQANFRIHCIGFIFMHLSAHYFQFNTIEYLSCFIIAIIVMIAELINTAIESTVDLFSKEMNPYAKIAKDCAAAAVLIAAISSVIVWSMIVYDKVFHN